MGSLSPAGGSLVPVASATVFGVALSRIGWPGGRMNWARILAYVTGTVGQELLLPETNIWPPKTGS